MNAEGPRTLRLADLREGLQAEIEFSVTAQQMAQFAALSGDFNPLHTDAAFARARGFDGAVVYGALIVAKVSQLIGMRLPGRDGVWASVALDFRAPLYVDETARVEGTVAEVSESTRMIVLKLTVRASGRPIAKGRAEVVVGR